MQVQQHRQVEPTFICTDVRNIGHPNLIHCVLLKLALQLVGRNLPWPTYLAARPFIALRGLYLSHSNNPGRPVLAARSDSLPQITNDSGAAVYAHALVTELFDLCCQGLVLHSPWRQGLQQPGLKATAVNDLSPSDLAQSELRSVLLHKSVFHRTVWPRTRRPFLGYPLLCSVPALCFQTSELCLH